MNPVKLGIIGCGIAARELHWPALQELKDKFKIVAVCNHSEPKAKQFSEMVGNVPYMLDYRQLLAMSDVEAVDIILPIDLNYQAVKDAAAAGKHIMVEKPLAANLTEAKYMVEVEKNYPLVTMVAENYRYCSVFNQIKQYLKQMKIGEIYAIFWNIFYRMDLENKYAQTSWRIHHQYPGGFVTDAGIHFVAALRDIFGDIYNISAFTKSVNPAIGELDSLCLQFTTPQKAAGVLNIFCSSNSHNENRLIILGKEGCIIVNEHDTLIVKRNDKVESIEKFENDQGYKEEFVDFYSAIRQNHRVKSTFFEAYCDLRVMIEALSVAKQ